MSTTNQTPSGGWAVPSTPKKKTAAAETYQSTPSNNGSASFAQGAINASAKVKTIWPTIRNDVSNFQPSSLSSMQEYLVARVLEPGADTKEGLKECRSWAKKVARDTEVQNRINALQATMKDGSEKSMYRPYVELQNEIIAQARKASPPGLKQADLEIICICSDPKVILGAHDKQTSYRRPDLVKVNYGVLRRECATTGELEAPPNWETARAWASEAFELKTTFDIDWSQVLQTDELKKTNMSKVDIEDIERLYKPPETVDSEEDAASRAVPLARAGQVHREKQPTPAVVSLSHVKSSGTNAQDTTLTGAKRKSGSATGSKNAKRQKKTAPTPAEESAAGQDTEPTEGGAEPMDVDGDQVNPGLPANPPAAVHPAKEDDPERPPPIPQLAIYGSEMMTVEGVLRTHTFGMLVQDCWVWLWRYDSAGAIQTEGFNVFAHTEDYVLLLLILQRFNLQDFGFRPGTNTKVQLAHMLFGDALAPREPPAELPRRSARLNKAPDSPTFTVDAMNKSKGVVKIKVDPRRRVYKTSPVLKGRRTAVVGATEDSTPTPLVAKWSYPQTKRFNEAEIVWKAHEILEGNADALKSLPDVRAFKDFEDTSTDLIRECLHPPPTAASATAASVTAETATAQTVTPTLIDEKHHGNRKLRLVVEKELKPITYLHGIDLVKAIFQIMHCNKLLWRGNTKYRIEHSDISLGNMAVDPDTLHGVLRDFDLARLVDLKSDERRPQGTERTGTVPFMAFDLLTDEYWEGKVTRLYRHDRESFIWVVSYIAFGFDQDGLEFPNSVVRDWLTDDHNRCHEKKSSFFLRWREYASTVRENEDGHAMDLAVDLLSELEREISAHKPIVRPRYPTNNDRHDAGPVSEILTADPDYKEVIDKWEVAQKVKVNDSGTRYNVAHYEQRWEKLKRRKAIAAKALKEQNATRRPQRDEDPELVKQARLERDAPKQAEEDEKALVSASKRKRKGKGASAPKVKVKAASAPTFRAKAGSPKTKAASTKAASTSRATAGPTKAGSTSTQNASASRRKKQ